MSGGQYKPPESNGTVPERKSKMEVPAPKFELGETVSLPLPYGGFGMIVDRAARPNSTSAVWNYNVQCIDASVRSFDEYWLMKKEEYDTIVPEHVKKWPHLESIVYDKLKHLASVPTPEQFVKLFGPKETEMQNKLNFHHCQFISEEQVSTISRDYGTDKAIQKIEPIIAKAVLDKVIEACHGGLITVQEIIRIRDKVKEVK
jgi:hypothetical protein